MLQRLLNTNPLVCIPPETTVLALLFNKYFNRKNWSQVVLKHFLRDMFLDDKIKSWWKISKKSFNRFTFEKFPQNFNSAIFLIYQFYAKENKENAFLLGDKNPSNSLYINQINCTYPDAKYIVMIRNPIDNIFSFQNVSFDSNSSEVLAHRWNFYNNEILKWIKKMPSKFHIVKFEELINNTNEELEKIASFLSIDNDFDISQIETGKMAWQQNLGKDISSKHISKGEKSLSEKDKETINLICTDTAIQFGYEMKASKKKSFHIYSWFFNNFEKHFVSLPIYLSASILKYYRKKSKIIVEN